MKIAGFIIMINAVVLAAWWVCTEHQHKPWAITIGLIAVFVGLCLMLQDRAIEITVEKVGTIKAAAEQAVVDAQVVGDLRRRIESQSATVDLVAESAKKAHNLINDLSKKNEMAETRVNELENASSEIQNIIDELQETSNFMKLVAAAQNGDRTAYEALVKWTENKQSPFWQHAADTIVSIIVEYTGPFDHRYATVPWPKVLDVKKLPIEYLRKEYRLAVRIFKADLVRAVWESEVVCANDKMSFFVEILKEDDSLSATDLAGKYFVKLSSDPKLVWKPFQTKPLLDWWALNQNNFNK